MSNVEPPNPVQVIPAEWGAAVAADLAELWARVIALESGSPTPPTPGTSYTVGAGDTATRLAAPTAAATMTIAQLQAAGGRITGRTVIRGGTWSSGQITISGSDVVLTGITFTSNAADIIRITGNAKRIRIHKNTFTGAGSSGNAGSVGMIKLDPHPSVTDNAATQRVTIDRAVTIDENVVTTPKDCFVWMNHGNRGLRISHNTISGQAWRNDGAETELIKLGWNDGDTDIGKENVVAFNTISGFEGRPYTMGLKQSDVLVVANQLSRRSEVRSADRASFIGNVLADGDLHGGGNGHTFKRNYIRTADDRDSFGPVSMYSSNGYNVYVGQPSGVPFYYAMTNSVWIENTFVNEAGSDGYGVVLFHSQYGDATARPSNNIFTDNLWVSRNNSGNGAHVGLRVNNDPSFSLNQAIAQNTWSGNRLYGITIGVIPGSILSTDPGTPVPTTVRLDPEDLPPAPVLPQF